MHINATQDRYLVVIINALIVNHKTYNSNKGRKTKLLSAPRTSSSSPAINRQRPSQQSSSRKTVNEAPGGRLSTGREP